MLHFERERIGAETYEAASVMDVDKDGKLDIVSGGFWYAGPDFQAKHKIATIMYVSEYYDDFSDYPMDVNGDGYLDIVAGGWFGMKMQWRENPKGATTEWTTHDVKETGNIERNCFYDIDGDGHVEVFSTTSPVHFFRLKRDAEGKGTGEFEHFAINEGGGGHGFGAGDLNMDGRMDMIFATGWMEAPEDPFNTKAWTWHPEFNLGMASVPILVLDVNRDGVNDFIVGQGHDYGLAWYEQGKKADGTRDWIKHDIETKRSQFHEMQLADVDNDGEPELVTGKRWRAHNDNDPGAFDPVGVYYYEINGGNFERITLDYGPAGEASGVGIYLWIEDVDNNGWKDIVAPGKDGLYLFRNFGPVEAK
ncbi:MAG: VCBS repeat-containing protein [Candidatus Hydrogenedentes bacterium]|nr:VCBS repeat-containing protein [Candidatus Hydrogenedentota bacterium]